ncbi:MAG: MATE family efflux transporter [Clostridium sp.]|nr:MATE family efflux transporter [Clostridium sp.]
MEEKKDGAVVFQNNSVIQSVLIMAVPTIISQMITVLYNYADTIFVGQLNDPKQVAAIALALPLTIIITALGNLWGIGGGSTISRALGKGDLQEAKRAAAFSFYGALILTGICCVAAFAMGDTFDYMLGASSADLDFTDRYIFWMFIIGAVPSVLGQVLAHFARSLGFAKAAGMGLTLGGILNIILDPVFIFPFGFNLGVTGAAVATMLSNLAALVYFSILFYRHREEWSVSFRIMDALPGKQTAIQVLSIGLPSALVSLLSAISNGVLNNLISKHGEVAVAAVGIAKKMDILPANIAVGITQGSLPLLAFSFGAGKKERTKKLLSVTGVLAFAATTVVVIFLEIFAPQVSRLFIRDTETVQYATQFIRRLCLSVPLFAAIITINSFFQAVNRPKHAFAISVIRKGIFDLPLMVLFDSLFVVTAIIWVQPIMDFVAVVVSLLVLKIFFQDGHG